MTSAAIDDWDFCADGHHCENGSLCTPNPYDEGAYYCDCDELDYEGVYCEHEATTECTYPIGVTEKSFCTNGGTCEAVVGNDEAKMKCKCEDGYEGEHCQFVKGAIPKGWPFPKANGAVGARSSSSGDDGLSGGAIFGIVVLVLAVVVLVAAFVVRRVRRGSKEPVFGMGEDSGAEQSPTSSVPDANLALEADGGVLQDAMSPGTSLPDSEDVKNGGTMPTESEVI